VFFAGRPGLPGDRGLSRIPSIRFRKPSSPIGRAVLKKALDLIGRAGGANATCVIHLNASLAGIA
jgi:hypothetical protein